MYEHFVDDLQRPFEKGMQRTRRLADFILTTEAIVDGREVFNELLGRPLVTTKSEVESNTQAIDEFFGWLEKYGLKRRTPDHTLRTQHYTFSKIFPGMAYKYSEVNGTIQEEMRGQLLLSRGIVGQGPDPLKTMLAAMLINTHQTAPDGVAQALPSPTADAFTLGFMTHQTNPMAFGSLLFPFRPDDRAHCIQGYMAYSPAGLHIQPTSATSEAFRHISDLAYISLKQRQDFERGLRSGHLSEQKRDALIFEGFLRHFFVKTPPTPPLAEDPKFFSYLPQPKKFVMGYGV